MKSDFRTNGLDNATALRLRQTPTSQLMQLKPQSAVDARRLRVARRTVIDARDSRDVLTTVAAPNPQRAVENRSVMLVVAMQWPLSPVAAAAAAAAALAVQLTAPVGPYHGRRALYGDDKTRRQLDIVNVNSTTSSACCRQWTLLQRLTRA